MNHEPRPAIHLEKQLGWGCKLGGVESLGIFDVGQTVLARLMESQLAGSVAVGDSLEKRQGPLLTLMPDTLVSPGMLVPFKLLLWC